MLLTIFSSTIVCDKIGSSVLHVIYLSAFYTLLFDVLWLSSFSLAPVSDAEDDPGDPGKEDEAMIKMMGFSNFDSTKVCVKTFEKT